MTPEQQEQNILYLKEKANDMEHSMKGLREWLKSEFGYGSELPGRAGKQLKDVYNKVFKNGLSSDIKDVVEFKNEIKTIANKIIFMFLATLLTVIGGLILQQFNEKPMEKNDVKQVIMEVFQDLQKEKSQ